MTAIHAQTFREQRISGFENLNHNSGVAVADYDRDGHLDVYMVANRSFDQGDPGTWSRLLRNNNDATFSNVTQSSGLLAAYNYAVQPPAYLNFQTTHKSGASWGDYDGDGYPDLFLTNYIHNKLYRNNGDGTFSDVTLDSGLKSVDSCFYTSAVWLDYDNDADLDLVVSSWYGCSGINAANPNKLYSNNGDGTFSDESFKIGVDKELFTWMMLPVNVNQDHWVDLLLVNDFGSLTLLVNEGGAFTDETLTYNLTGFGNHMGAAYADFNHDDQLDLYIADMEDNELWVNQGEAFVNQAVEMRVKFTGTAWQTRAEDLDMDGRVDLLIVNGKLGRRRDNVYFRNNFEDGVLSFSNQSEASGTNLETNSMGFELFDYDHDGDLDYLLTLLDSGPVFLENQAVEENPDLHWVKVDLEGTLSNRSAIGTQLVLTTRDGRKQHRYFSGAGFMNQSLQPVHFGLGRKESIKSLRVIWPLGLEEEYHDLPVNTVLQIKENEGYSIANFTSNKVSGCRDIQSCNYDPNATHDDGTCQYLSASGISGPDTSLFLAEAQYFYEKSSDENELEWRVVNGELLDGQGTSSIRVKWSVAPQGTIYVIERGECIGQEVSQTVSLKFRNEAVITGFDEEDKVLIYPNPVEDKVFFQGLVGTQFHATVFDLTGRLVAAKKGRMSENAFMDISSYPSGTYLLGLSWDSGYKSVMLTKK